MVPLFPDPLSGANGSNPLIFLQWNGYVWPPCQDLLHLWSGGEFRSAKHRVVNGADDRLTISYFAMPNYDATIAPVPTVAGADTFAPIRAGDISHFTQLKREEEGLEDPQLLENQVVKSTTSTSP